VWLGQAILNNITSVLSNIKQYFELYLFRFGYGLSYNKDFEKPGVKTCSLAETCGCSSNDWGYDCHPSYGSCAKGCDFANEMKDLFFHGPDVTIDPTATCSGHGICTDDGSCKCDNGFFAADCSSKLLNLHNPVIKLLS
jgi:hypothetical protein